MYRKLFPQSLEQKETSLQLGLLLFLLLCTEYRIRSNNCTTTPCDIDTELEGRRRGKSAGQSLISSHPDSHFHNLSPRDIIKDKWCTRGSWRKQGRLRADKADKQCGTVSDQRTSR
ncbi:hypothetical protein J6590_013972 [Homalodisca vitripennis]|nr:hypothetical protein J6590_013972 [Homalodisca vitripennis]